MNRKIRLLIIEFTCLIFLTGCASTMNKAAYEGDISSIQQMVKKGKNLEKEAWTRMDGYSKFLKSTPLTIATIGNHKETCKILIEAGADINQPHDIFVKSSNGTIYRFKGSPIMAASVVGDKQLVKLFVDNGANLNVSTEEMDRTSLYSDMQQVIGLPLLNLVANTGNTEIAEYLIQKGLNPNSKDIYNCDPLLEAAFAGHMHMVKSLLDNGATININEGLPIPTAMLCHFGAQYYTQKDEQKALLLYKQASEYYPVAARQWEKISADAKSKNFSNFMTMLAVAPYATHVYNSADSAEPKSNADQCKANGILCNRIVELYEKGSNPLSECAKAIAQTAM